MWSGRWTVGEALRVRRIVLGGCAGRRAGVAYRAWMVDVGYRSGDRMKTYVALFRRIDVGGNNILPMKDLVTVLE